MSGQLGLVSLTASALYCWGVGSGFEGQGYCAAVEEALYLRAPQSLPKQCAQRIVTDRAFLSSEHDKHLQGFSPRQGGTHTCCWLGQNRECVLGDWALKHLHLL